MLRTSFAMTVPAHRPTRLGPNILLTLGTMTLAQVMAPAVAQAQCNSGNNPSPPPPVVANFSNQSFGNNPPLVPYNIASLGLAVALGRMVVPVSPAVPAVRGSRAARSAAQIAA